MNVVKNRLQCEITIETARRFDDGTLAAGWFGSRVVSVLDSGAEKQRCRVTVLGKLFTPVLPLFIKQRKW